MRRRSVAARVFLVQTAAVLLIGGLLLLVLGLDARRAADDDAAALSLAVSETIATNPDVAAALEGDDPTAELQPYALDVIDVTGVDFVTIMSPDGVRYTHPDPSLIGQTFLGTITAAKRGETLTETYTGSLGPSVRAVVPIESGARLVGIVSAGVTTNNVATALVPRIPFVLGTAVVVVLLGTLAAGLARRSVRKVTGDLAPDQMERMLHFYESVLHSVREGVVLTDPQHRVVLYNDEAADLLGLPPASADPEPRDAGSLGIDPGVADLLSSGRRVVEESHLTAGRVLLINQEPSMAPGDTAKTRARSTVMTLRDQSAVQGLAGELESVRTMADALSSQAHEHANQLHTIASLIELGRADEAAALISEVSQTSQELADTVLATVSDPVLAALLLGKASQASERGIAFSVDVSPGATVPLASGDTVSVVGNLLDNALEAALGGPPPRRVGLRLSTEVAADVRLEVSDSGSGIDAARREKVFELGFTGKPAGAGHGVGLAIVRQIVTTHGGTIAFADGTPTTVVVTLPAADRTTRGTA